MTARIICLIIFILEVKGLSISLPRRKWEALAFYTQLSNIVTVISALLLVILGKNLIITSIVCLVFAIFTEAIKIGIVGRHFSWTDVGLNLIGAVAGIVIELIFALSKPQESVSLAVSSDQEVSLLPIYV